MANKAIFKMAATAMLNFKNFNFGHETAIWFTICYSVPNFIKIGQFFTEIWRFNDLAAVRHLGCYKFAVFVM